MNIHFIAIGGSVMHSLALALHKKGYLVSGSDDEIFEPARSHLDACGLLPSEMGWHTERINRTLDAVILGMHAKPNNPELLKAKKLGVPVYSYPDFIYRQSREKVRVVIGGSHGKTTVTAMVMHVLKKADREFDFLVGASPEGFSQMLRLGDAPLMIIEGDEYLSSPMDKRPKFILYRANIGLINGIAWDHINVFPTVDEYVEQFRSFIKSMDEKGTLIYYCEDRQVRQVVSDTRFAGEKIPYSIHPHTVENGKTKLLTKSGPVQVAVFGKHNMQNISAARSVCTSLGIDEADFYKHIASFKGAARRLELVSENPYTSVFTDFAHSPSKLKATVEAVRERYPHRRLVACTELHTYSSLNGAFLREYRGALDVADDALVYFNSHALTLKGLPAISERDIREGFARRDIRVFEDAKLMYEYLIKAAWKNATLLLMSSGNFGGMDLQGLAGEICRQ